MATERVNFRPDQRAGSSGTVAWLVAGATYPMWAPIAWARSYAREISQAKERSDTVETIKKLNRFLDPDIVMGNVESRRGYLVIDDDKGANAIAAWWVDEELDGESPTSPDELLSSSRAFLTEPRLLEKYSEWFDDIELGMAKVNVPLIFWQRGRVLHVTRPDAHTESRKA